MSRTQNVKEERLDACVKLIREHNKEARIITTPWEQLTGGQILDVMENTHDLAAEMLEEQRHHHEEESSHEHHHHDEECDHGHHHHDGECEHGHHHHGEECGHEHHHQDGECGCGHDHHHHHADEVFTSWGRETARKYTKEELESILKALSDGEEYGIILRSKGMIPTPEGEWMYFDMVPEEYEIRNGSPEYTGRICVIGSKLKEDKLEKLFLL